MTDLVSTASPSPSVPRDADAPFNDKDSADVVLRSADKVDFHVHKLILSFASPVFKKAFDAPQPAVSRIASAGNDPIAGRQVINMPEDSHIIDFLMRCCYPIAKVSLDKLAEIRTALDAGQKYGMPTVVVAGIARDTLFKLADEHPLDIISISLRCDLYDAFSKAFERVIELPSLLQIESEELDRLSVLQYRQLIQYIQRHKGYGWMKIFTVFEKKQPQPITEFNALKELRLKGDILDRMPGKSSSRAGVPFEDRNADVILRSCDGVSFYVYKVILSIASPFFKHMFSLPQPCAKSTNGEHISQPIIDMAEDARTLDFVLRCIYPVQLPDLKRTDIYFVLDAGRKYEIQDAICAAEAALVAILDRDPLGAFALAVQCQIQRLCALSARRLLKRSPYPVFISESNSLACISARPYRKLLQYHQHCGEAASAVARSRNWLSDNVGVVSEQRFCIGALPDNQETGWFAHPEIWDYLGKAERTLRDCPLADSVFSPSKPIDVSCVQCGRRSYGRDFCLAFKSAVEDAIAEDKIKIPKFC